jgi:outer membrane protein assembly factor BamB
MYLISNRGTENEFVQALSAEDGRQLWETRIGNVGPNKGPQYPGSRSTPTVDGDVLFVLGSDGDLACLDTANGKPRWSKNLRDAFAGMPGQWAYSESPLIDGEVLVCSPGGSESTIVALEKKNGEVIWKTATPEGDEAAYASAIIIEIDGLKQYVEFLQKGLVGVEAATGKLLWRYDRTAQGSAANIPTPVASGQYVYSAAGRSGGGLVKLSVDGESVEAEPMYFAPKLPNSIGGSVLIDGYLYGTSSGGLMCVEYTSGEMKWQGRGVGAGSVCFADGRIYVHGEKGDVAIVEATPDEYREKGKFSPPDQPDRGKAQAWCYPVVANGRLYIRDLGSLWCYDVKQ